MAPRDSARHTAALVLSRPLFALMAVVLAALALSAGPSAAEGPDDEPDHVVHAGAVPDDPLKPYSYMDYFPRDLQVHQGDRVRWEYPMEEFDAAFHTVTFAPDREALPWMRPDEVAGTYAFGEGSFFSSGCGRPGQPVCVLTDPEEVVSSGTPMLHVDANPLRIHPFDAVVDLPPGTYTYFCTIHEPAMEGTIEVVEDDVELDNPAPEDFADHIAELTAEADALVVELSDLQPTSNGAQREWTVHTGARTRERGGVVIIGYLPASLTVRPGDAVRWVGAGESDGVTFPDYGAVPGPFSYFQFGCDPDEPDGGAPGVPLVGWIPLIALQGFGQEVPCPPGTELEMAMSPLAVEPHRAPGNAIVSPATFHNSGVLMPLHLPDRVRGKPAGSGEHFASEFDATFPVPGTFPYRCQIHMGVMGGSVTVEAG